MKTILVIETDKNINNMLKQLLESKYYKVYQAFSKKEGVLLHNENVNLILLDLMLSGKEEGKIISKLKQKNTVPIIVMSAIHEIDKKIKLLELGADDYLKKPFHNDELLARIKVQLNNNQLTNPSILKFKDIELNTQKYSVICNNQTIPFTKYEFEILKNLIKYKGQVLTKSMLFELVWKNKITAADNSLNVHISKIRNKLKKCNPTNTYIETVRSVGYCMKK